MASLNSLLFIDNHVVTEIVKAHFIVCTVSNIGVICLFLLVRHHIAYNKTHSKAQKVIKLTHPFAVTLCKVIVYSYNVNPFACKGIKVCRKCSNQSFTFTCFHFSNSSLMKNDTTDNLNIEMLHSKHTPGGLTADRKGFRENVVKSLPLCKSFLKFKGFIS